MKKTHLLSRFGVLLIALSIALAGSANRPHAQSIPPASTAPFAYGVAAGDMTTDSAVLWTRTPAASMVTAELSTTATFDQVMALPAVQSSDATDFTVKVAATGLKPGTHYYYRFKAGSDVSAVGSFETAYAPDQNAAVTLAFSGDVDWKWKPYPLLNTLTQEKLDFFVFLGDLLYETTDMAGKTAVEDLAGYRWKYRENREPRPADDSKMTPMLNLYGNFGQYSVFDNHETGLSKADKNAPSYNEGGATVNGTFVNQSDGFKARIQAYREYQPVVEQVVQGTGDARLDGTNKFYKAVRWGANVELIKLDDRSYRDARIAPGTADTYSCNRTMLGAPQVKWLQDTLMATKQDKVTWKVIIISSPIQELGVASQVGGDLDGGKSWPGDYLCERNKILGFIDQNAIDNVVFLTTDDHYTVINNLSYNATPDDPKSALKPARNAFEVLTGPIGASAGNPSGLKVSTKGLAIRDADKQILGVWNGDLKNTDGVVLGLKTSGLDPIGLEATFPGLDVASLRATGVTPGTVDPLNFASFNTYAYALLTFDQTSVTVTVKGFPIVTDPSVLEKADALKEYESRKAEEILSFKVKAQ